MMSRNILAVKYGNANHQRGVALIMAVLVAAMITATAVAMATTHRFSMQRGFNQVNGSALQFGMQKLESDISILLAEDRGLSEIDSLNEIWATKPQTSTFSNTVINAVITDLQALYNLANLATQFGVATPSSSAIPSTVSQKSTEANDSRLASAPSAPFALDTSNANPNATPAASIEKEIFDWQAHQEFVDSYVESCADENQKCAEQAIALAYQQSLSLSTNQTSDAQDESQLSLSDADQSNANAAGSRQPNSPSNGVKSADGSDSKALDSEAQLSALFRALELDLEPIQAILDWIDSDSETRYPNGAEDEYYTGLEQPYRAGNGPFATVRELLLVRGISSDVYEKLAPYLAALPQSTPVNINTASSDLLMSIHPMIDRTTADLLIDARNVQAFQSVKAFAEHPALLGLSIPVGHLSVSSDYFQIDAKALSSDMQTHHRILMRRSNANISTLRRARGYFN